VIGPLVVAAAVTAAGAGALARALSAQVTFRAAARVPAASAASGVRHRRHGPAVPRAASLGLVESIDEDPFG
jgi:hypothetical protein